MGQKVNPHGLRVGIIKDWDSRWFAQDSQFGDLLVEDYNIRKFLKNKLFAAGVSKIEIERTAKRVKINIFAAKPGIIIGRGGSEIDKVKKGRAMKMGVKGIKTSCAGRLGGAEIARTEHYHEGTIPLQTLRADIDYGFWEANTTYGKIGVKVWIYKGEILPESKKSQKPAAAKA